MSADDVCQKLFLKIGGSVLKLLASQTWDIFRDTV